VTPADEWRAWCLVRDDPRQHGPRCSAGCGRLLGAWDDAGTFAGVCPRCRVRRSEQRSIMTAAQARELAERQRRPENRTAEAIVRHARGHIDAAAGAGKTSVNVPTRIRIPTTSRDWTEAWDALKAEGYKVGDGPGDSVRVEW
jgi:hypothetical protein